MMMAADNRGFTVWFTGLSGAGKTTLAEAVRRVLANLGLRVEVLDGDEVRTNLSKGLGYSKEDRDTNIRRIGYVARLLSRNGVAVVVAAISPYRDVREEVRRAHETPFVEVFVECPLEELIRRDRKGLYSKALRGEVLNFTGVSDSYEPPTSPDIHLQTAREPIEESARKVIESLRRKGLIAG
jgi:adenylylsulfate kinase